MGQEKNDSILYVGSIKIDMQKLKSKLQTEKSYLDLKDKFKNIQDLITYFLSRKKIKDNHFYLLFLVSYTYQWNIKDLQKSMDEEIFKEYLRVKRNVGKDFKDLEQIIGKIQKPRKNEMLNSSNDYVLEKFSRNWHQPSAV